MDKRRIGWTILGCVEIIYGLSGIYGFVLGIFCLILALFPGKGAAILPGVGGIISSLPSLFLFIAGIGVLRSKNWAKKINIIAIILVIIQSMYFFMLLKNARG